MAESHKNVAIEFMQLVASNKVREAYEKHVAPGFRHHNPFFRGDAASLMQAMEDNASKNPGKALEVHAAIQEGDHVAVLSHVWHNPDERGFALVHIFRFEKDRIAELWDIGQPVPEHSANENGMF